MKTINWYVVVAQTVEDVVPASAGFSPLEAFTYIEFKTRQQCREYARDLKRDLSAWEEFENSGVTRINIQKRTTVTDHMGNDYFTEEWVR